MYVYMYVPIMGLRLVYELTYSLLSEWTEPLIYSHKILLMNQMCRQLASYPGSLPYRKTGREPGYEAIDSHIPSCAAIYYTLLIAC